MRIANIWQVYYNATTKRSCLDGWNHYDNRNKLNCFFENQVILDLYHRKEHRRSNYFGVFSHAFATKHFFKNGRGQRVTPQSLDNEISQNPDIDLFGFHGRRNTKNVMLQAERYHQGGFKSITQEILDACGYDYPNKTDFVCLFNHFVGRADVYDDYIKTLLEPAMKIMTAMGDRLFVDQKYKRVSQEMRSAGLNFYPLHPFICERLPSVYYQQYYRNLSFKQIF